MIVARPTLRPLALIVAVLGGMLLGSTVSAQQNVPFANGVPVAPTGLANIKLGAGPWIYPTGETQTVIKGKFDFNWQIGAELAEPIHMPQGTRMVGISHFDNSPNNPFNPDAKAAVKWGPQNWEEMSNCFMGLIYDGNIDPKKASFYSGPSKLPRGTSGPTLSAVSPPSVPK